MPDYAKMSIKRLRYCLRRAKQTQLTMYGCATVNWYDRFFALYDRILHIQEVERRYFRKRQELLQLILCCRHSCIALNTDILSHIFQYL